MEYFNDGLLKHKEKTKLRENPKPRSIGDLPGLSLPTKKTKIIPGSICRFWQQGFVEDNAKRKGLYLLKIAAETQRLICQKT